jgi:hypothetical protein
MPATPKNREVALQAWPIPDSSLQQVQTAIAATDNALHVVDQHFTKRLPTMYDHLDIRDGSKSLLWIVRRGRWHGMTTSRIIGR